MLRPLLNVYHERLKVGRSKVQLDELEREINRPPRKPGQPDVPRSRGTKALMALMGMPPPPPRRPPAPAEGAA